MTPQKVIEANVLSLARAELKIDIWNDVKAGRIVQKGATVYDPDERIQHWTALRDKYLARVKAYVDVPEFLNILVNVLNLLGLDVVEKFKNLILGE